MNVQLANVISDIIGDNDSDPGATCIEFQECTAIRCANLPVLTVKCFTPWLGLCPGTKVSGGKRPGTSKRATNRAAQSSLRLEATPLHKNQSVLRTCLRSPEQQPQKCEMDELQAGVELS
ncbi:MAG: hypothetical protein Q7J20_03740, partial [Candidatus Nitrotoga sp.]|nr:hypothetical protein [Candidatus Nitrotoga sp.]